MGSKSAPQSDGGACRRGQPFRPQYKGALERFFRLANDLILEDTARATFGSTSITIDLGTTVGATWIVDVCNAPGLAECRLRRRHGWHWVRTRRAGGAAS